MLNERGFLPIGDSVKRKSFPVLTIMLILVNVFVFFFSAFVLSEEEILRHAFIPAFPSIITVFTHMFLHADLFHLLGNMWFFWIFGDNVEDKLGKTKFLFLYFFSGLGALTLHYLLNLGSAIPIVGASGAISGILGAYVLMFRNAKIRVYYGYFFTGNLPAWVYAFIWFGFQFLYGIITFGEAAGIAFFAHIGGFLAGMLLVSVLKSKTP